MILLLPLLWVLYVLVSFLLNLRQAKSMNLPLVASPIYPFHPVWVITQKYILPLLRCLPFHLGTWTRFNYRGWQYVDKYKLHRELGDAYIMLSPGTNAVFLANPEAVDDVLSRRKDFIKPTMLYSQY